MLLWQFLVYRERYLTIRTSQNYASVEQRLITLALMSSIPVLLLDSREKNASFSSFMETVCSSNSAFMELIYPSKGYFDNCIFSASFGPIFTKKLLNSFAISFLSRMFFPLIISFSRRLLFIIFIFPMISFIISQVSLYYFHSSWIVLNSNIFYICVLSVSNKFLYSLDPISFFGVLFFKIFLCTCRNSHQRCSIKKVLS